jgi:hypothetical protein
MPERCQAIVCERPSPVRDLHLGTSHGLKLRPDHRQLIGQRARVFVDRLGRPGSEAEATGQPCHGSVDVVGRHRSTRAAPPRDGGHRSDDDEQQECDRDEQPCRRPTTVRQRTRSRGSSAEVALAWRGASDPLLDGFGVPLATGEPTGMLRQCSLVGATRGVEIDPPVSREVGLHPRVGVLGADRPAVPERVGLAGRNPWTKRAGIPWARRKIVIIDA